MASRSTDINRLDINRLSEFYPHIAFPLCVGDSCSTHSGFESDGHQNSYGCGYIHAFVEEVDKLFEKTKKDAAELRKDNNALNDNVINELEAKIKQLIQKYFDAPDKSLYESPQQ